MMKAYIYSVLSYLLIAHKVRTLQQRYIIIMVIAALALLAALVACYFYYLNYLKPRKLMGWYKQILQQLGYRVIALPFTPMRITLAQLQKNNETHYADAFYDQKHSWHNYDIVLTNTGNIATLILLKPALLKSFFSANRQPLFYKSLANKVAFNLVLKDSLIFNEDAKWKRKRKIFTDILNFQFIRAKIPQIVQICEATLTRIERQNRSQSPGSATQLRVPMAEHFKDIVGEVVIKLFFGCQAEDLAIGELKLSSQLSSILAQARNQSSEWLVLCLGEKAYEWGLGKEYKALFERIKALRQKVRQVLQGKMPEKRQPMSSYNDLLESLYFLRQRSESEQFIIETQEFISQFLAFMTASNDTTGNYLNMLVYYLSTHPNQRQQLQQLLRQRFHSASEIDYYQLRDIQYFDWCLQQTTRMYGPASSILLRQATTHTYIENIPIVQGTGIKIEMLASHYNPRIYKDPFKFDPARWSTQDPDTHPFSFGGFGSGAHSCIGKQLALLTTKIVVCVMLLRYDSFQIENAEKVQMVTRGLYQPTAFRNVFVQRQHAPQDSQQAQGLRQQQAQRERQQQLRQMLEYQ